MRGPKEYSFTRNPHEARRCIEEGYRVEVKSRDSEGYWVRIYMDKHGDFEDRCGNYMYSGRRLYRIVGTDPICSE